MKPTASTTLSAATKTLELLWNPLEGRCPSCHQTNSSDTLKDEVPKDRLNVVKLDKAKTYLRAVCPFLF